MAPSPYKIKPNFQTMSHMVYLNLCFFDNVSNRKLRHARWQVDILLTLNLFEFASLLLRCCSSYYSQCCCSSSLFSLFLFFFFVLHFFIFSSSSSYSSSAVSFLYSVYFYLSYSSLFTFFFSFLFVPFWHVFLVFLRCTLFNNNMNTKNTIEQHKSQRNKNTRTIIVRERVTLNPHQQT